MSSELRFKEKLDACLTARHDLGSALDELEHLLCCDIGAADVVEPDLSDAILDLMLPDALDAVAYHRVYNLLLAETKERLGIFEPQPNAAIIARFKSVRAEFAALRAEVAAEKQAKLDRQTAAFAPVRAVWDALRAAGIQVTYTTTTFPIEAAMTGVRAIVAHALPASLPTQCTLDLGYNTRGGEFRITYGVCNRLDQFCRIIAAHDGISESVGQFRSVDQLIDRLLRDIAENEWLNSKA